MALVSSTVGLPYASTALPLATSVVGHPWGWNSLGWNGVNNWGYNNWGWNAWQPYNNWNTWNNWGWRHPATSWGYGSVAYPYGHWW